MHKERNRLAEEIGKLELSNRTHHVHRWVPWEASSEVKSVGGLLVVFLGISHVLTGLGREKMSPVASQ